MPSLRPDRLQTRFARALLLVAFVVSAFAADAQISHEHPVSTVTYGPAPGHKQTLTAVFDGENYFAVWEDYRDFFGVALYAARVNERGALLDQPTAIRLPFYAYSPVVVVVSEGYAILWRNDDDLFAALLDRNGAIAVGPHLVAAGVPVAYFSAAFGGSAIAVVFPGRAYLVDERTQLIERDITLPPGRNGIPGQIASNSSGFFMIWEESTPVTKLKGIALDSHAHPIGQPLVIGSTDGDESIASNGSDYLVLYRSLDHYAVRRISADGQTAGAEVALNAFRPGGGTASLAPMGSSYLVTFPYPNFLAPRVAIEAIRVGGDGQVLSADPVELMQVEQDQSFAVVSGRESLAVFTSGLEVVAVHAIDKSSLRPIGDDMLARSSRVQGRPSIAFSGRNYLAVWAEGNEIRASRLSLQGEPLDGTGILIGTSMVPPVPRVVFDGEHYVIAWSRYNVDGTGIRATRLEPDTGNILDGDGVTIDAPAGDPASLDLAFDGQSIAAVWSEYRGRVHVARFNRSLQTLDARVISPSGIEAGKPSIAGNGSGWLVVFEKQYYNPIFIPPLKISSDVLAVRLSPLMTVLDPEPIVVAATQTLESANTPQVVSDGDDFLVAWTYTYSGTPDTIRGRYFRSDAFTSDTFTVLDDAAIGDLSWDGARYSIAYTTRRGPFYDVGITHAGRVDRGPFRDHVSIATGLGDGEALYDNSVVAVMPGRAGANVVAYTRLAPEPLYGGVFRVFVREAMPASRTRAVRAR